MNTDKERLDFLETVHKVYLDNKGKWTIELLNSAYVGSKKDTLRDLIDYTIKHS